MPADWQYILKRIRQCDEHNPSQGFRRSVLLAFALGALTLGAGILIFVSAYWDEISPAQRFTLALVMVAILHVGGAFVRGKFLGLSMTLHAVGTIALGKGIFLTAQIFNLEEHWPSGILLWLVGAAAAWMILGDWPQGLFCAILLPWWLAAEWFVLGETSDAPGDVASCGLALMAVAYLIVRSRDDRRPLARSLEILGGVSLIPVIIFIAVDGPAHVVGPLWLLGMGVGVALLLPLSLTFWLRRQELPMVALAAAWIGLLDAISRSRRDPAEVNLEVYGWCVIAAVAMIAWGVKEARVGRINLGILGIGITVLVFYFDHLSDKMGRAESLISVGIPFLYGGWVLQRLRRRLVARIEVVAR